MSGDSVEKINILKNELMVKRSGVCSHIFKSIESGLNKIIIYPLATQIYEDGYDLQWYCDKCREIYFLPEAGAYIYDAGESMHKVCSELAGFSISTEENTNPYMNFLNGEKGYSVKSATLEKHAIGYFNDPVADCANILHIPFGLDCNISRDTAK